MSAARIVDRTVTWTNTVTVGCGVHRCEWCRVDTPQPSDEVVIEFVKENPNASTMWPGPAYGDDGWTPPGWVWRSDLGWLCPDCEAEHAYSVSQAKARRVKP